MNISLNPEQEQFIHNKVSSGKYLSASEVVAAGLKLLEEREKLYQEKLAELQAKIDEGIAASDRGDVFDGEDVFAELEEDIKRIEAEQQQTSGATL